MQCTEQCVVPTHAFDCNLLLGTYLWCMSSVLTASAQGAASYKEVVCVQGRSAEAEDLLLHIYSSINEPDGIYAVASGHSMVSQLKLYEHEGSWDKALTGYDLLCRQHTASGVSHTPSDSTRQHDSTARHVSRASNVAPKAAVQVDSQWQQGLLTSLQQLGCRHVIEAYWHRGQTSPGNIAAAGHVPCSCSHNVNFHFCSAYCPILANLLQSRQFKSVWSHHLLLGLDEARCDVVCAGGSWCGEMQAESAWRLGQWELPPDQSASPSADVGVGTNEAICGCLKVQS